MNVLTSIYKYPTPGTIVILAYIVYVLIETTFLVLQRYDCNRQWSDFCVWQLCAASVLIRLTLCFTGYKFHAPVIA